MIVQAIQTSISHFPAFFSYNVLRSVCPYLCVSVFHSGEGGLCGSGQ